MRVEFEMIIQIDALHTSFVEISNNSRNSVEKLKISTTEIRILMISLLKTFSVKNKDEVERHV